MYSMVRGWTLSSEDQAQDKKHTFIAAVEHCTGRKGKEEKGAQIGKVKPSLFVHGSTQRQKLPKKALKKIT